MLEQRGARLGGLDAVRGIAATIVVLYHCARHLNHAHPAPMLVALTRFGHAGVDLFFVLSGFIILFIHQGDVGKPARLRHYAARRFSRVIPTYWVALALTLLAAAGHGLPAAKDLAIAITLCPSDRAPLLGVAWTLQYEIVFYAVFATMIFKRSLGLWLMAAWFAWVLASTAGGLGTGLVPRSIGAAYNLEFLFGMGVAHILRGRRLGRPALLGGIAAILLVAAAIAEDTGAMNGYASSARLAYGLPAALLIAAIVQADRSGPLRIPAGLRLLGDASYSIYLFQFVMIGAAWQVWLATGLDGFCPAPVSYAVLVSAALGGGILASRLIEQPALAACRQGRLF